MIKSTKSKRLSLPVGIAIGVATSILISVAGAMLLTGIVNSEQIQLEGLNVAIAAIHLIASFLGAWFAYLLTKQMRLIVSSITAGGYMLVLCGITALIFDGQYQGFWITLLMTGIGTVISILPGIKGRKGNIRKNKIPAYR